MSSHRADALLDQLVLVEPLTKTDWDRYFDLRWRVLREPWNQPRGTERDDLDPQSFHLMLREPSGGVVAVGRLHLNSPDEAQIRYMAVDRNWRGHGLGSRILKALERHAQTQAARSIVLNSREEACDFYAKHGYRVEGPADTLFGKVRHVRMRKELQHFQDTQSSSSATSRLNS